MPCHPMGLLKISTADMNPAVPIGPPATFRCNLLPDGQVTVLTVMRGILTWDGVACKVGQHAAREDCGQLDVAGSRAVVLVQPLLINTSNSRLQGQIKHSKGCTRLARVDKVEPQHAVKTCFGQAVASGSDCLATMWWEPLQAACGVCCWS